VRARVRCALVLGLLLAGCTSAPPQGPVGQPARYPDRTSALATWETYVWAWREGDVDVLEQVYGLQMQVRLQKEIEVNGREETGAWYRRGAQELDVREAEWVHPGEQLSYLRVVMAGANGETELDFSFLKRADGWVITGQRQVIR
jgi:hypothetical protein